MPPTKTYSRATANCLMIAVGGMISVLVAFAPSASEPFPEP